MHETAVAGDLVHLILEQIGDRAGKVAKVRIRVGAWCGVAAEALASAYSVAARGLLAESELVIETSDLVVFCPQCNVERTITANRRLRCPVCDVRTPRIVRGAELELISIEMNDDAQNP